MAKAPCNTDILSDILDRVATELKVPVKDRERLERDLRRAVGGEMHYIAKTSDGVRVEVARRDESIRADARRGESPRFLARKYKLSPRRIQQILQGGTGQGEGETVPAKRFA
jgi:Mor family transcriptional regulator